MNTISKYLNGKPFKNDKLEDMYKQHKKIKWESFYYFGYYVIFLHLLVMIIVACFNIYFYRKVGKYAFVTIILKSILFVFIACSHFIFYKKLSRQSGYY